MRTSSTNTFDDSVSTDCENSGICFEKLLITALYSMRPSIKRDEGIKTLHFPRQSPPPHPAISTHKPPTRQNPGQIGLAVTPSFTLVWNTQSTPGRVRSAALPPLAPVRSAQTRLQSQTWAWTLGRSIVLQGGSVPRNHLLLDFNKSASLLTRGRKKKSRVRQTRSAPPISVDARLWSG